MILIIDNFDSFTFNIVQYISKYNDNILIKKNNEIKSNEINSLKLSHIVISPGPGNPNNAGNCLSIINDHYKHIPILGVCLGHQAIGEVFGAIILEHSSVCHGKVSTIFHNGKSILYKGIPSSFKATRYHSLVIDRETLHNDLSIISILDDGTIMGIEHNKYPLYGVQFHPESIETFCGEKIIENFIKIA